MWIRRTDLKVLYGLDEKINKINFRWRRGNGIKNNDDVHGDTVDIIVVITGMITLALWGRSGIRRVDGTKYSFNQGLKPIILFRFQFQFLKTDFKFIDFDFNF